MYSNFPGFRHRPTRARQNTNIFRVPPGGGAPAIHGNSIFSNGRFGLNNTGAALLQARSHPQQFRFFEAFNCKCSDKNINNSRIFNHTKGFD
jgi:hypothetical protein